MLKSKVQKMAVHETQQDIDSSDTDRGSKESGFQFPQHKISSNY